jgi:hypothetical protein
MICPLQFSAVRLKDAGTLHGSHFFAGWPPKSATPGVGCTRPAGGINMTLLSQLAAVGPDRSTSVTQLLDRFSFARAQTVSCFVRLWKAVCCSKERSSVSEDVTILADPSHCWRSRGSSGSIVSGYGMHNRAIEYRFPAGAKDFSSNLCVQTGSGAHPASCPIGTRGHFSGGKVRPRRDAEH